MRKPPAFIKKRLHSPRRLVVTDFDGTLYRSDRTVARNDIKALKMLGDLGICRVIATGRSMFSMQKTACRNLPIDYVVFSTGAGVARYPEGEIIRSINLEATEVDHAVRVFAEARLDFMVHKPIPQNHVFAYRYHGFGNPDFLRRLELYRDHCRPLPPHELSGFGKAAQLVAIVPPSRKQDVFDSIRRRLSGFSVIRATSPLDGESIWIEVFPSSVSKSRTTAWLANQLGIRSQDVLSIGNDYNDIDLLEWSGSGFVVGNAPADLKSRFRVVATNNDCGVDDAIKRWLKELDNA